LKQNATYDQASALSLDLVDESNRSVEETTEPAIHETKITRVYKKREKVKPKVVRRSVQLSKKIIYVHDERRFLE
jgi:hypothetical protein